MDILQGVSIFLAVALIVFVMSTVWLAFRCNSNVLEYYDQQEHIEQLREDNKQLLSENVRLLEENQRLIIANDELKSINTELSAPAPVTVEPEQEPEEPTPGLLPEGVHTNIFRCEPYTFAAGSDQQKLQERCETDPETGIRRYGEWYCAALAGAYGIEIGHCYTFTLANGTVIPVILSDFKHPIDNIRSNDYGDSDVNYLGDDCICVIEFVVDMNAIPEGVKMSGTMSVLNMFGGLYSYGGDIVKIEYLGRKWKA